MVIEIPKVFFFFGLSALQYIKVYPFSVRDLANYLHCCHACFLNLIGKSVQCVHFWYTAEIHCGDLEILQNRQVVEHSLKSSLENTPPVMSLNKWRLWPEFSFKVWAVLRLPVNLNSR